MVSSCLSVSVVDSSTATSDPHVVIVGGGFAGLHAARGLRRAPVRVTLIDRRNHHLFQPLLYQVATGSLSPANIAAPLRSIVARQKNCEVVLGEVVDFDPEARRVILKDAELVYDVLIVAAGARHSYFGHDEWEPLAPGLKSIEDATTIRRRILSAFEQAEREDDPDLRRRWMTFVVVGAGPTGVELAGSLSELARHTLKHEFRHIDPDEAQIILLDAADSVLSAFPEELSKKAAKSLEKLHVTVRTGALVTAITPDRVTFKHGEDVETIATGTVLWAAGVQASPLGRKLAEATDATTDRAGRIVVEPDMTIAGRPELLVLGDLSNFSHQGDKPLPGLGAVASQQGKYAARLIRDRIKGRETKPFHYRDRGTMATIGRSAAVAHLGRFKFGGFFAWLLWLFVHLMLLVKFENRVLVFVQWAWNYLTFNRSARLITGDPTSERLDGDPSHNETGTTH